MSTAAMARGSGQAGPSGSQSGTFDYLQRVAFTQILMQRVCLPEEAAKQLYKELMGTPSDSGYLDLVADINRHIGFCSLRLARMIFPLDKSWYIAIINKVPDEVSKAVGSSISPAGIHFLRSVLEGIALSPDAEDGVGYIGSVAANNLSFTQTQGAATQAEPGTQTQAAPKLSMAEKDALLPRLVREHWLAETPGRRGCYSIGVRSFLELKHFLLSLELPEDTRAAWEKFL